MAPSGFGNGVIVLGMHRSGTSMATGLIEHLGFELSAPEYLGPPHEANREGNRENRPLLHFNERLLNGMSGGWASPPELAPGWETTPAVVKMRATALQQWATSMPDNLWLWKDPRLCLTLPFWRPILSDRFAVVVVLRHPGEVARSLNRRNGFSEPLGLALWERYVIASIRNAQGLPVALVRYTDLLSNSQTWLQEFENHMLGWGHQLPATRSTSGADSIPKPSHRHHSEDENATAAIDGVQAELYENLCSKTGFYPSLPALASDLELSPWSSSLLDERRRTAGQRQWLTKWDPASGSAAVRRGALRLRSTLGRTSRG